MAKVSIMIVEDEAIIAKEIKICLEEMNYTVTSIVKTGELVLEKAFQDRPDLILMDIHLKGQMDGIKAAELIRSRFDIPVIFLTAHADEERLQRAKFTMPFGYILKPFQERDLKVTIEMGLYAAEINAKRRQAEEALQKSHDELERQVKKRTAKLALTNKELKQEIGVRKQIEKELRESEEKFIKFFRLSPSGMVITSLDEGRVVDVNESFTHITGYTYEESLGRISTELGFWIKPEDREEVVQKLKEFGSFKDSECNYKNKSGQIRLGMFSSEIINLGETSCIITTITDITDSKLVQQALLESEERFHYLADASMEAIFFTKDGFCLEANEVAVKMFGYDDQSEFIGMLGTDLTAIESHEIVKTHMLKNILETYEAIGMRKDGTQFPISIRAKEMPYKDKGIVRVTSILDITERKRIDNVLRKSEAKYRAIYENSQVGLYRSRLKDGKVIMANNRMAEMFGYENSEECVAKYVAEERYVDLDLRDEFVKVMKEHGKVTNFEAPIKTDSGSVIWLRFSGKLCSTEEYFEGVATDVTEEKLAKKALKSNEANLVKAQRIAHLGSWDWNIVSNKLSWSDEMFRIFGLIPEKSTVSFETFLNLVHPEDREAVQKNTDKAFREGALIVHEHRIVLPTGEVRTVYAQAETIVDKSGRLARIIGTLQDITDRKQAEAKLSKSKETLRSVVDGISDPLVMLGKDFSVKLLNKAALKYYRTSGFEKVIGKPCFEGLMEKTKTCEGCGIPAVIQSRQEKTFERKGFMDPEKIEQVVIYPLHHQDHLEDSVIIRISDVTRERQIERELIQADKMISLGVLVSGMAHEINNPNNFVMLNGPLLREAWESIVPLLEKYYDENGDFSMGGLPYSEMRDEVPKLFSGIKEGSKRIQRIVKDLKEFARQDETSMDHSVNINQIIESSIRLTGNLIKKATENSRIKYGRNLPLIRGNKQKLEQVMINLIQNACQALPDTEKGIFITSSFDKEGGGVVVEVRDEGEGIPEKLLLRIMDPFFTTKRNGGGTGLGLSISSKIVREHRGKIEVESKWGKGTAIRVFIPTARIEKSFKILVIDDDSIMRKVLTKALGKLGIYSVREASNGTEAFLKIGQEPPDLLILDVQMPEMDGAEVCRLIKEKPELSAIKVIIITGFPQSSEAKEIARMGFDKMLAKPFSIPTLLNMVDEVLEVQK